MIHVYTLNEKGYLQEDLERTFKTSPGTGPRKMIFSHDKKFAYCINEISSTIATYAYQDGHFTLLEEKLTYIKEDFEGVNVPTDFVMTDDNQYIAVTNKGDDTIVLFERGDDGLLKRKDLIETDAGPVALEIFRDRWLVVVSKQGGSVESFEIRKNESLYYEKIEKKNEENDKNNNKDNNRDINMKEKEEVNVENKDLKENIIIKDKNIKDNNDLLNIEKNYSFKYCLKPKKKEYKIIKNDFINYENKNPKIF